MNLCELFGFGEVAADIPEERPPAPEAPVRPRKDDVQPPPMLPDADVPLPPTTVPRVPTPSPIGSGRAYITPAVASLLAIIRSHEGGWAGYDADYRNDDRWTLSDYTFDEVRALGRGQVIKDREASSAIGGYQFITKTLDGLKVNLNATWNSWKGTNGVDYIGPMKFTHELQDDLAYHLMVGRGFNHYLDGGMTAQTFCNSLAKEWASLPVVTTIRGAHRTVYPGQSYYAGDGLNAASHKPDTILDAVKALKS